MNSSIRNPRALVVAVSLLTVFITLAWTSASSADNTVMLGRRVSSAEQVAMSEIDHTAWDILLQKYVDTRGMVDYSEWKKSRQDQQLLDSYLLHLSAASTTRSASRESRLAFWINAYNAVTVKGILLEYPTSSIRNHTAALVGYNIWKHLQLFVGGKPYSLDDMEHEILRKMDEPRIHFAIVCASMSCPPLLNHAYTERKLNDQLAANATAFFADASNFSFDTSSSTAHVSPILDWFAADFGSTTEERLRTIAPYLPESARDLVKRGNVRVRFLDYDWSLNDQAPERPARK